MSDDVSAGLIRALIENMRSSASDWESLAMILEFPEGAFNEAHGYLYSPGGVITAVASDPWAVGPAVDAYTGSRYEPGEALPLKLLVQFDRTNGAYRMTFEDTDESRWTATPRNYKELREDLRPNFADRQD